VFFGQTHSQAGLEPPLPIQISTCAGASPRNDRSTLVVYDPKGKEALYVRYINISTIAVRGRFFCADLSVFVLPNGDLMMYRRGEFKGVYKNNCIGMIGTPGGITFDLNGVSGF
jgi:hypothetical protein